MQHAGRTGAACHARSRSHGQPAGHGPPLPAGFAGALVAVAAQGAGRLVESAGQPVRTVRAGRESRLAGFRSRLPPATADPADLSLRKRAVLVRALQVAAPLAGCQPGARAAPAAGQPRSVGLADPAVCGPPELPLAQVPDRSPGPGIAGLPGSRLCGTGAGGGRASVRPGAPCAGEPVDPAGHVPAGGERAGGADRRVARVGRRMLLGNVQHAGRGRSGRCTLVASRRRCGAPRADGSTRRRDRGRSGRGARPQRQDAHARRVLSGHHA